MDAQCVGKGLRMVQFRVLHLDDTIHTFQLSVHAIGKELYASMVDRLQLLEADYFDLEYANPEGLRCWLDHEKPILRQVNLTKETIFRFGVKFYTPYPNLLEEEYACYLYALQIKRDLLTGSMLCSENTAALLASYIVQAEIGDFIEEEYVTTAYLHRLKLMYEPTEERLQRVRDFHKAHIGLAPSDADLAFLDTARKAEFYGLRLHFVRNHEGLGLNLTVSHLGILVYQNLIRVNTFSWAKVRKLSFKRKRLQIKLQPERMDAIEFIFDSREECKQFWKTCIEHHTFFRCPVIPREPMRKQARVGSGNSTYRYTGRTQQELSEYVQKHIDSQKSTFKRPSASRRAYSTILHGSSYPARRLRTASMQLRSSSVDRRSTGSGAALAHLGLTGTQGRLITGQKRTQSEGPPIRISPSIEDVQQPLVDTVTSAIDIPMTSTSGYATMPESAESGRSTEGVLETVSAFGFDEPGESDTLTWIDETYRRMTGDWTGSLIHTSQRADTSDKDNFALRRAKSYTTTTDTANLEEELDQLLKSRDQNDAIFDDGRLTHLLLFGELHGAQLATNTTQVDEEPLPQPPVVTSMDTTSLLSNLTNTMFVGDQNLSELINLVTSPIHQQSQHEEQLQANASSVTSETTMVTTQSTILNVSDATAELTAHSSIKFSPVCVSQQVSINEQTSMSTTVELDQTTVTSYGFPQTQNEPVSHTSSVFADSTLQHAPKPDTDASETNITGSSISKTLFFLPTVTQYGLDINIENASRHSQQFPLPPPPSLSTQLQEHQPHEIGWSVETATPSTPTLPSSQYDRIAGIDSQPYQHYYSAIQTSGVGGLLPTMNGMLPTHSISSVPETDTYKPTAGGMEDKKIERMPKMGFGQPIVLSKSIGQIPTASAIHNTSFGSSMQAMTQRSKPNKLPTTDQWSSESGSDSTTGVILRSDVIPPATSTMVQHKPGCPHSYHDPLIMNRPVPTLPVDTLPSRPSQRHRTQMIQTFAHSANLSKSIPNGVHLNELDDRPTSKVSSGTKKKMRPDAAQMPRRTHHHEHITTPADDSFHPDIFLIDPNMTADMLEEVPYVVVRRPRTVDAKQYQLHLQRQQQQVAALAAAYGYHPGAPYFAADPHVYPPPPLDGGQYTYTTHPSAAPFMHHYQSSMASAYSHHHPYHSRSQQPQQTMVSSRTKSTSSTSSKHRPAASDPGGPTLPHSRANRQAQNSTGGMGEPLPPVMLREKCKAKRKLTKSTMNSTKPVMSQPVLSSSRITVTAPHVESGASPSHIHHAQCVHSRRRDAPDGGVDPYKSSKSIRTTSRQQGRKPIAQPESLFMATDSKGSPMMTTTSRSKTPEQQRQLRKRSGVTERQHKRNQPELDESRERDMPYPVSELMIPPGRHRKTDGGDGKTLHNDARRQPRHQHHPACASLMGKTRSRIETSGAHSNGPRPGNVVRSAMKTNTDGERSQEGGSNLNSPTGAQLNTRETIEQLRQELRSACSQVSQQHKQIQPVLESRSKTTTVDQGDTSVVGQSTDGIDTRSRGKTSVESSLPKMSKEPNDLLNKLGSGDGPSVDPSHTPTYLDSDTDEVFDSQQVHRNKNEPATEDYHPIAPHDLESVVSPRSRSPSLPLSQLPSDEEEDRGLQSSDIGSTVSSKLGSQYDDVGKYFCPDCDRSSRLEPSTLFHPHHHPYRHHFHHYRPDYYYATCHCHSCQSRAHRRHLSEHREGVPSKSSHHRHHSHYHIREPHEKVDSAQHRTGRRHRSWSSTSEQSWTNSESALSSPDEVEDFEQWSSLAERDDARTRSLLKQMLVQERRLRNELAKHRALTAQLKQARQEINKSEKKDQQLTSGKKTLRVGGTSTKSSSTSPRRDIKEKRVIKDEKAKHKSHTVRGARRPIKPQSVSKRTSGRHTKQMYKSTADEKKGHIDQSVNEDLVIVNLSVLNDDPTIDTASSQGPCKPTESTPWSRETFGVMSEKPHDTLLVTRTKTDASVTTQSQSGHVVDDGPTALPPTPPTNPPPMSFLIHPREIKADHPMTTNTPQLSSTNQLNQQLESTGVDAADDSVDSEYDGTHALNLLTEVIENAMSATNPYTPPIAEKEDESTHSSSLCDASETSVETVKNVRENEHPRSPSPSSSSASEGSEDIEPFPPPPSPPPQEMVSAESDFYAIKHRPISHLFPTDLDGVIEEETICGDLNEETHIPSAKEDGEAKPPDVNPPVGHELEEEVFESSAEEFDSDVTVSKLATDQFEIVHEQCAADRTDYSFMCSLPLIEQQVAIRESGTSSDAAETFCTTLGCENIVTTLVKDGEYMFSSEDVTRSRMTVEFCEPESDKQDLCVEKYTDMGEIGSRAPENDAVEEEDDESDKSTLTPIEESNEDVSSE